MGDLVRVAQGRDKEMIELHAAGKTMSEIGEQYGITRQRVCQILQRYGVKVDPSRRGRKPVAKEVSEAYVAEAVALGNKIKAAEKFGVSPDTIGRALRRAGVSLRSTKFTTDQVKSDIIARYHKGERLSAIAQSYDTRAQHVNSLLRKWGVEAKRAALWKRQG